MDRTAVSDQIDRILRSPSFASKAQLRKLLEVLHRNIDSQENLNPELVIKELWPNEIRTKRSADVATEMNRLRHAVDAYYKGEGKGDPITIVHHARPLACATVRVSSLIRGNPAASGSSLRGFAAIHILSCVPFTTAAARLGRKVAAAAVAACVVGVAALVGLRNLIVQYQPKFGRLDGSALVIMNAEGKELWRKVFPEGSGPPWYYEKDNGPRIWFADLEGKGHTSVLFSYLPAVGSQPRSSTLICYSDRGKEKWRWTPGRDLPELNGSPAIFRTMALGVLKATAKRPPRIAVANEDPWWPSQIAILDSNGKTISEYWHSGHLDEMRLMDLEGDGREEIVATGIAHGYDHLATLVVLDPERVFGASTEMRPEFQIHGMGVAQERLRLLFPPSDLNRAPNSAVEPAVQRGNLRLAVPECPAPKGCLVWYEFDKSFHLVAAYPENDEFRIAHDQFFQKGKDAHTLSAEEEARFLSVRCLVGCKTEYVPVFQTYNPATSFEKGWTTQTNPNGVWSYGYSSGFTNSVTLYDKTVKNGVNGPNAQYWISPLVDVGTSPAAEYNDGPAYNDGNVDLLANEFLLVAGVGGQYSDLTFTAPEGGEYSIAGNFRGSQYLVGTVVGIVANRKVVFSSSVSSASQLAPFRITLKLQAGSTVVFSVGPGRGMQNTGLSVTITKPCVLKDKPTSTPTGEITCSSSTAPTSVSIKPARNARTLGAEK